MPRRVGGVSPEAFRIKFRKLAACPASFYRGNAALLYANLAGADDPFLDEYTSRVWIHGARDGEDPLRLGYGE